jgi:hypothetical protein
LPVYAVTALSRLSVQGVLLLGERTVTLALVEVDPLLTVKSLRAAAEVVEVDEGHGFRASVLVTPDGTVARLDRSLEGAPDEGDVLRWVMLHATGLYGCDYFDYRLDG